MVQAVKKKSTCNVGDLGSIPGGEHGNPLQDSCLENPHGQKSLAGYSPWDRRVGHDLSGLAQYTCSKKLEKRWPVTGLIGSEV